MADSIRVLFLADSHLGIDLPLRPRVKRRRRGDDFLANYAAALEPARRGEADLVVHGGDVFDVPGVSASVAWLGLEPLRRVAELGVPVFVVPGNHERARIPHAHLLAHPRVHVFDRPRTFELEVRGRRLALAGFPYERRGVRALFPELLAATRWQPGAADASLLCIHQCVEGATVGPVDFTFSTAADVVRGRDIPAGFAAVLAGHIHRHQVLTRDLAGRPLAAPVLYPGSIERTALAEIGEPKGFMTLELEAAAGAGTAGDGGVRWGTPGDGGVRWGFRPLPARPMLLEKLAADGLTPAELETRVRGVVAAAPADAVLTIRIEGELGDGHSRVLSAGHLRTFVPETMNVTIQGAWHAWQPRSRGGSAAPLLDLT